MADGTRSCCGTSWLDDCVCPPPSDEIHRANCYRFALHKCGERYRDMMLATPQNFPANEPVWLFNMEFLFGCRDGLPVPKLCRWLGYIQGVLIERGLTTVDAERDWTRPLFRPLDFGAE